MTEITDKIPENLAYLVLVIASENYQKAPFELNTDELQAVIRQAEKLYQLQEKMIVEHEAVVITEQQLQESYLEIQSRYQDEEDFKKALENNQLNESALKNALKRQLMIDAIIKQKHEATAFVYYQNNRQKFVQPETRTVRHILITINKDFKENTKVIALQRIRDIKQKVTIENFADYALKNSECPSAMHGGLIGTVPYGKLYPELDKKLFKMQENQISDPIETQMGYHIIWCEAILPVQLLAFEKVKDKIIEKLIKRS